MDDRDEEASMRAYRVISGDSHVVEPPDIWTERMPKKFGDRIPRLVHEEYGDSTEPAHAGRALRRGAGS